MNETKLRKVEKLTKSGWLNCRLKDIRSGDTFRLFENNGQPVGGQWVATDDATVNPITGVWGVESKDV